MVSADEASHSSSAVLAHSGCNRVHCRQTARRHALLHLEVHSPIRSQRATAPRERRRLAGAALGHLDGSVIELAGGARHYAAAIAVICHHAATTERELEPVPEVGRGDSCVRMAVDIRLGW